MTGIDTDLSGWDKRRVDRVLANWPLFGSNSDLRGALLAAGRIVRFEAGAMLIQQGHEDCSVFFLLRGEVDIFVNGHLVAVRLAGQHVGEMAAINPKEPRSATVKARDVVLAWRVEGEDIAGIGADHPVLWRSFASELADRLAQRGRLVEHRPAGDSGPLLGPGTIQRVREATGGMADFERMTRPGAEATPLRAWLLKALASVPPTNRAPIEEALRELELTLIARGGSAGQRRERIIQRDDMLPFEFAPDMLRACQSVAHLTCSVVRGGDVTGTSFGTGWLITPHLLVTAFHVVQCRDEGEPLSALDLEQQIALLQVRFGFHTPMEAGPACSAVALVASSDSLDYAIVRLKCASSLMPLRVRRGALRFPAAMPMPVNVVQHPGGGPKRLGIRNNLVAGSTDTRIRYFTDTEPGSSGAPVLNDRWEVVAVHTGWEDAEPCLVFQGERTAWVNRGTRIDRILGDLRDRFPAIADEIEDSWGQITNEPKAS